MPTLKAILFDFDGVIIDSETPEYQIWQSTLARFGVRLPLHEWARGVGSSIEAFDPLTYLEEKIGHAVDRQALLQEHKTKLMKALQDQPPLPGVQETILNACRLGLRLAIASSSSKTWVTSHLEKLGFISCFHAICTREDVPEVKPAPHLYNLALYRLGVHASEAIVIEDSPNGILAAKQAGIFCIAVPNPVSSQLDISGANLILPSLEHLDLSRFQLPDE
ncbi:haloacid dehalogenase superfamily, subfamily IA, variant 3 with third motif having DD or ED [Anaerolinea thermolimosa]|uniref:HAD family hydrolase n=1 Tax=Anaerolinea thermolimosa TaxID=229919 RepID=UPI000782A637|nr:HAD family hydrolase [Anaerolinea thermolimosa]GAP06734.1 haloacid dehalogenase superfamily, subfamily IA, variant 3 with third motif having DD or ED [Anaerolinea thermolimosa]